MNSPIGHLEHLALFLSLNLYQFSWCLQAIPCCPQGPAAALAAPTPGLALAPVFAGRCGQRLELLLTPSQLETAAFTAKNLHAQPSLPPALLLVIPMCLGGGGGGDREL